MASPMAASIRTVSRVASGAGTRGAESEASCLSSLSCDLRLSRSEVSGELFAGEGCMLGWGVDIVFLALVMTVTKASAGTCNSRPLAGAVLAGSSGSYREMGLC